jgi:glycosyltransferase involved in cell wall biosynthesis
MKYSVLMSVYKNEKVEYFKQAIESLLNQTAFPDEIVLVRDGAVYEELQGTIDSYVNEYPNLFTYLPLEENGGLGNALRYGLPYCRNELIGRMDTDDISVPNRFESQLEFMQNNPDVDIVGGNIAEFIGSPDQIVQYRVVYSTHDEIVNDITNRSPMNHVTVMFKKSAVLKAGNYESFYQFEDWYLWVKMYLSGCKFANLNDNLVNVRIFDMSARRGGMKYYKSCKRLLKIMKQNKIIGTFKYVKVNVVRFIGYVLLPNKLRSFLYTKMLRKKTNN